MVFAQLGDECFGGAARFLVVVAGGGDRDLGGGSERGLGFGLFAFCARRRCFFRGKGRFPFG